MSERDPQREATDHQQHERVYHAVAGPYETQQAAQRENAAIGGAIGKAGDGWYVFIRREDSCSCLQYGLFDE